MQHRSQTATEITIALPLISLSFWQLLGFPVKCALIHLQCVGSVTSYCGHFLFSVMAVRSKCGQFCFKKKIKSLRKTVTFYTLTFDYCHYNWAQM